MATFIFTPNKDFNGADSFEYSVSDGEFSDEAIIYLAVNPINDAPTAENEFIDLNENTSAPVYYLTNDVDGDELSNVIISGPNNGSLDNGIYTPNPGFSGSDLFVYQAFDGLLYSNQASVTFDVIDVNDPPSAISQEIYVDEDNSASFALFGSDPDGDSISFALVGSPENGLAQLVGDLVVYTPSEDFFGDDFISFVANDGEYDSEPGTVTVHVIGTNDPPSAEDFEFTGTTTFDFSSGVSDPDGDELTLSSIPPGGDDGSLSTLSGATLVPNGDYVYSYSNNSEPAGDVLLFKAS